MHCNIFRLTLNKPEPLQVQVYRLVAGAKTLDRFSDGFKLVTVKLTEPGEKMMKVVKRTNQG